AALMAALGAAFRSRAVAVVGGLLFALQPAQVSAVAWIGGRTDSLCALWVALFAWALIRAVQSTGRRKAAWIGVTTIAYSLALLTKEQALALLPLVPLAFRCFRPIPLEGEAGASPPGTAEPCFIMEPHSKSHTSESQTVEGEVRVSPSWRAAWQATIPSVLVSIGFVCFWVTIRPQLLQGGEHGIGYKLALAGRTLVYYARLLLAPTPQAMHSLTVIALERAGIWSVLGGYALLALSIALILRWMRRIPAAAWFLALAVLWLLPVSNFVPLSSLIVAPFRASVAGLGIAGVLAWAIALMTPARYVRGHDVEHSRTSNLSESQVRWGVIARVAAGGSIAVWYLWLSLWGVGQWDSQMQVYSTFARYDPGSMYVQEGLIGGLMEAGKVQEARNRAEKFTAWLVGSPAYQSPETAARALKQNPAVLARIHSSNGDKRTPAQALSDLYVLLGYARIECGDRPGALAAFRTGEALCPKSASVNLALGRWYFAQEDWRRAMSYFHASIAAHPRIPASRVLLAKSYAALGRWQAALGEFHEALRLQSWDGRLYAELAAVQTKMGDRAGARKTLREALEHALTYQEELRHELAQLP
ncbi:MAG TPA: hypothetical protein VNJ09_07565, partial [Chthonomonadales bacterium]|nr:hypothetical protein [Chthonomonadales bacterium]